MNGWQLGTGSITAETIAISQLRTDAMGDEQIATTPICVEISPGGPHLNVGYKSMIVGRSDVVGVAYFEEFVPAEGWFEPPETA